MARSETKDSNYYLERAQVCLRWAALVYDLREAVKLQELANEYTATAQRLLSIERATINLVGGETRVPARVA